MGKKIIVLDGDPKVFALIDKNMNSLYQGRLTIYQAKTFSVAERLLFNSSGDIELIVWGSFVNDSGLETMALLRSFKRDFPGKIIGISDSKIQQTKLVKSGCDFACSLQSAPYTIARSLNHKTSSQ